MQMSWWCHVANFSGELPLKNHTRGQIDRLLFPMDWIFSWLALIGWRGAGVCLSDNKLKSRFVFNLKKIDRCEIKWLFQRKKKSSFNISFTFWTPYFLIGSILNVFYWTERIMEAEEKCFGLNQDFFFALSLQDILVTEWYPVVASGGRRMTTRWEGVWNEKEWWIGERGEIWLDWCWLGGSGGRDVI